MCTAYEVGIFKTCPFSFLSTTCYWQILTLRTEPISSHSMLTIFFNWVLLKIYFHASPPLQSREKQVCLLQDWNKHLQTSLSLHPTSSASPSPLHQTREKEACLLIVWSHLQCADAKIMPPCHLQNSPVSQETGLSLVLSHGVWGSDTRAICQTPLVNHTPPPSVTRCNPHQSHHPNDTPGKLFSLCIISAFQKTLLSPRFPGCFPDPFPW